MKTYVDSQALAQAVSRILGKQYSRSQKHTTRVMGWYNRTEGFQVTSGAAQDAWVEFHFGHWDRQGTQAERKEREEVWLQRYAETLREAGFVVEERRRNDTNWLINLRITQPEQV